MKVIGGSVGGRKFMVVEVVRTIEESKRYRITSSYGYAGVTEGIVEVSALLQDPSELDDVYDNDMLAAIESYKEAELSCLDEGSDEYLNHKNQLDSCVWVAYYYPYEASEQGNTYAFPLDMFVAHTSTIM